MPLQQQQQQHDVHSARQKQLLQIDVTAAPRTTGCSRALIAYVFLLTAIELCRN
jgi:hypothetical protein